MKRLIITADDFGAALAVNEAVEQASRNGVLTAASLMVAGDQCADAVARARRTPGLRVGLHLVLVEGRPVLPPSAIPDLVASDGCFRRDMAMMGSAIFFRPEARRQVAAEIEAQFEAFLQTGLTLDHVNAHKHYHLHPTVASLLLKIGRRYGAKAGRAPVEPRGTLATVDPSDAPSNWLTEPFGRLLRARYRGAGVIVADQVFGLGWSGAMTPDRLSGLIAHLPSGVSEIYLHPAITDDFPGATPGYRYAAEFAALMSPDVATAVRASGAELCAFGDLTDAVSPQSMEMAVNSRMA